MPDDDPLASAKAFLSRTEKSVPATPKSSILSPSKVGKPKPKMKQRTTDIRLYAPGEQDQPTSIQQNIEMRKKLQGRAGGRRKRGGSQRA
jgi:hypothetical protein